MSADIEITVGVCAYNEEGNIERSIHSIYEQDTDGIVIDEVIVISSGSTDGTDDIVKSMLSKYDNLKFLPQREREGKNSAINCLLENKKTEIVVLLNADNTLGNSSSLSNLIKPFSDPEIGIVGGRPVPTNNPNSTAGFASQMLWSMHHHLSMIYPKLGELIAFRDIGTRLPLNSQSDEDIIRMKLEEAGYLGAYAPNAIIKNRGPETVDDFIKQRTRVNIGERYMKRDYGYYIPTWDHRLLINATFGSIKDVGFHPMKMLSTAFLELISRLRAMAYVRADKGDMSAWDPVSTTKKL